MDAIWFRLALTALGAGAIACAVGCSAPSQSPLSSSLPSAHASAPRHPQFVIPAPSSTGDYLGAQVNPNALTDPGQIESETEALDAQVYKTPDRHFALHAAYRDWVAMLSIGSDVGIKADIANGRVPVIAWRCGDDAPPNSAAQPLNLIQIANGEADSDLAIIKAQLLTLTYPGTNLPNPMYVRYFWEFNINAGEPAPNYDNGSINPNGNNGCFVQPGTGTNIPAEPTAPPLPFIDAWNHIHLQLSGTAPVPQLTYVWNPSVTDADPEYGPGQVVNPLPFYPGDGVVDWIGLDAYQRLTSSSPPEPASFTSLFQPWYNTYSPHGKPMMIGETASCQAYSIPQYTSDQASYILSLQSNLEAASWKQIRALLYFDAKGTYQVGNTLCNWILDLQPIGSDPTSGIAAFTALANDKFFSPPVEQP
jgi:hypothetical protein